MEKASGSSANEMKILTTRNANNLPIASSLNEKAEFIDAIVDYVWKEWSYEYMNHTSVTTPELLRDEIEGNIKDCRRSGVGDEAETRNSGVRDGRVYNIPMVYVLYVREVKSQTKESQTEPNQNKLVGFCFIEIEDSEVMTWLTPWLANVYITEEYRGKGYGNILINYVTSLYSPLYLWTETKELIKYYEKFGFSSIATIPEHGELRDLTVMRKE